MGFFSTLLSSVVPILTGVLSGGSAGAAAQTVANVLAPPPAAAITAPQAQPSIISAIGSALNPAGAVAPLAIVGAQIAAGSQATLAAAGGVGQANIFTRTIIQRVSRVSGNVLTQRIERGSPFLMNSEVRSLRRVSKMINKAHGKVPRRAANVSSKMIEEAVSKRLMQLNQAQCLLPGPKGC